MTAASANRDRLVRGVSNVVPGKGVGADSSEFYAGAMVCHNNAGRIARAADTANFKIAGVVKKRLTTGASNALLVEFEYGHEEWFINDGTIVAASIGLDATILDDQTASIAGTTTNDIRAGKIMELETIKGVAGVWIRIGVMSTAAA
jgi:hypothetical protein